MGDAMKGCIPVEKSQNRRLKYEYREEQKRAFFNSLPMPRELFQQLFDFLDEKLVDETVCSHNLLLSAEFLSSENVMAEPVLSFLEEHGGYCDCEVLYNVEEKFRDDAIF